MKTRRSACRSIRKKSRVRNESLLEGQLRGLVARDDHLDCFFLDFCGQNRVKLTKSGYSHTAFILALEFELTALRHPFWAWFLIFWRSGEIKSAVRSNDRKIFARGRSPSRFKISAAQRTPGRFDL